jgi:hypothetical protein
MRETDCSIALTASTGRAETMAIEEALKLAPKLLPAAEAAIEVAAAAALKLSESAFPKEMAAVESYATTHGAAGLADLKLVGEEWERLQRTIMPDRLGSTTSKMGVPAYKVLANRRSLYASEAHPFDWGNHFPTLTNEGWRPGKPLSYLDVTNADPGLQRLIQSRAGNGAGLYVTDDPARWVLPDAKDVYQVQFLDKADVKRWNRIIKQDGPGTYQLQDFDAWGQIRLLRKLTAQEESDAVKRANDRMR